MKYNKPQNYFGSCDRQMEAYWTQDSFVHSLVFSILFHGDVVVPDIHFWTSGYLRDLLLKDPQASVFLSKCLRNGALVPAFRTDQGSDFRGNLEEIRAAGIAGIQRDADAVCEILEQSSRGKRIHTIVWPNTPFSVGYRRVLERVFLGDIEGSSPTFSHLWERTQNLRDALFDAIKPDDLGGFRKTDVHRFLLTFLRGSRDSFDDIREIWQGLTNEDDYLVAHKFSKWFNYCYYYNQASCFKLNRSLNTLDDLDCEFVQYLAQIRMIGSDESSEVVQSFRFPSATKLLTVDPKYLFEIRDSEIGSEYFEKLTSWQDEPTQHTSSHLLDCLEHYTASITSAYLEHGRSFFNWEWHINAKVPTGPAKWAAATRRRPGREIAFGLAKEIVGVFVPGLGLTSLVGKMAAASYEALPAAHRYRFAPAFGIGERIELKIGPGAEYSVTMEDNQANTDATFY